MIIDRYQAYERTSVFKLYAAVWGKSAGQRISSRWNWEFCSNPYDVPGGLIFTAKTQNEMVGLFAVIPVDAMYKGSVIKCGWAVDLMVHPFHRKKHVFSELNRKVLEAAKENGLKLLFTFPNLISALVLKKLGWRPLCWIPVLVKPLTTKSILKKVLSPNKKLFRIPFESVRTVRSLLKAEQSDIKYEGFKVEMLKKEKINSIWPAFWLKNMQSNLFDFIVVRDATYIKWRYFYEGMPVKYSVFTATKDSELAGYIVLRQHKIGNLSYGYIVDILVCQEKTILNLLLKKTIEFFSAQNVDLITCKLSHKWYQKAFIENGFVLMSKPFGEELYAYKLDPAFTLQKNFDNWFITRSDADTDFSI